MEEIKITKKYMNKYEFRNYVLTMLCKNNYQLIGVDDERVSDSTKLNDNDLKVLKGNKVYTVQTYLNGKITDKEIEETKKDMEKEKMLHGIIVTNYYVNNSVKNRAKKENIKIYDFSKLKYGIYGKVC